MGLVGRLHADYLRANPAAKGLRYGWARQGLSAINRRPLTCAVGLASLYAIVVALTVLAPPVTWGPIDRIADYYRDFQAIDLALLAGQAALLGLVYPLVIALVGLLFEARSGTGGGLHVYFKETEALTVGGSALALVGVIALQSPAYGQLVVKVVAALTILNTFWFVANLAALAFFVARSLDFVRPARRQGLMRSYLANTAWSAELRDAMIVNRWFMASTYGYLPRADGESGVRIDPFGFGAPILSRSLTRPSVFKDARFGFLGVALARHTDADAVKYRPWPGLRYETEVVLAAGTAGNLSWAETRLIRWGLAFGPPPKAEPTRSTAAFLKEATSGLVALFDAAKYDEFDAQLDNVVDLHGLLYGLAQEPPEPGSPPFNYAAMEIRLERVIGLEWARAYVPLLQRVGDTLIADGRFFEACAFLPARLLRRARPVAPFEALAPLFFPPFTLFRALVMGAVRRHAEALATPPVPGALFTPSGPGSDFYRRAWHGFVGGWEAVGEGLILQLEDDDGGDWEALRLLTPALKRHLHDTALMAAQAARTGERQAIGWTVDMLLKWREKVGRPWRDNHNVFLKRSLITLAVATRPWPDVEALPLSEFDQALTPMGVFGAALENAWLDTLVVLVSSLIGLQGRVEANGRINDGPAEAASRLLRNQSFDPGAGNHPHEAPLTADAVLRAILRLVGAGERFDEGYGGEIGALAETIGQLEGPNYISSRIYGWTGGDDVFAQADPQVILLAATMINLDPRRAGPPAISETLRALLLPDADLAKRRIQDHLRAMREAVGRVDVERGRALIATLRQEDVDAAILAARLAKVVALLEACEAVIIEAREAQIRALQPDPGVMAGMAKAAAATGFSGQTGAFPLPLFHEVAVVDAALPISRMPWTRYPKGALTVPPLAEPTGDEPQFVAGEMRKRIGAALTRDVTQARGAVVRRPRSATAYWTAIQAAAAAVRAGGQTPIVVRANRTQPAWAAAWLYRDAGDALPPGLTVTRLEDQDPAYDFNLNDLPVYSSGGAERATWVFGQEILRTARFQRFASGELVSATFVPDPNDVWRGTLDLTFGHEVDLADGPVWRIDHPAPPKPLKVVGAPTAPKAASAKPPARTTPKRARTAKRARPRRARSV